MEFALAMLPFLLVLACPLMMVVCFVGMRKKASDASPDPAQHISTRSREAKIAALEDQLTMIQGELQALRNEEAKPAPRYELHPTTSNPR